jgi:transcriptional regulator with XRE-family HTH domain
MIAYLVKCRYYYFLMPKPRKNPLPTLTTHGENTGARLIKFRKLRGLTQTQLAEKVGVTRYLLAHCEKGRTRLTDDLIVRFAIALHITPDELLGFSKTRHPIDKPPNVRLIRRMQRITRLPTADQKAILRTIDSFIAGSEYHESK